MLMRSIQQEIQCSETQYTFRTLSPCTRCIPTYIPTYSTRRTKTYLLHHHPPDLTPSAACPGPGPGPQTALTFEDYAALLPNLETLRQDYKLDAEVVFHLYRPVLRKVLQMTAPVQEEGELEEGEEAGGWLLGWLAA